MIGTTTPSAFAGAAGNGRGVAAAATTCRPAVPARAGRAALALAFAALLAAMAGGWPNDAGAQGAADASQAERPMAEEPDQPSRDEEEARPRRKIEKPVEREDDEPVMREDVTEDSKPPAPAGPSSAQRKPAADRDDDDETVGEEPAVSADLATSPDSLAGRKKVAKKHSQPAPPPPHGGPCEPRPNQLIPPCITFEEFKKLRQDPAWQAKRDRMLAHTHIPSACSTPDEHGGTAGECPHLTAEQVAAAKKLEKERNLAGYQSCRMQCSTRYATCYSASFCPKKRRECIDLCESEHAERESSRLHYDAYLDEQLSISGPRVNDRH